MKWNHKALRGRDPISFPFTFSLPILMLVESWKSVIFVFLCVLLYMCMYYLHTWHNYMKIVWKHNTGSHGAFSPAWHYHKKERDSRIRSRAGISGLCGLYHASYLPHIVCSCFFSGRWCQMSHKHLESICSWYTCCCLCLWRGVIWGTVYPLWFCLFLHISEIIKLTCKGAK